MSPVSRVVSVLIVAMLFAMVPSIDANSGGINGQTTSGCNCHSTTAMIVPTITGLPSAYSPGVTYSLSWTSSSMSSSGQGGFNLDATAGTWSNLGARVQTMGGELTHSSDGQRSWTADWTAPSMGTGDVTFDVAILFADGNGYNSGDNWGTRQYVIPEGAPPPNTLHRRGLHKRCCDALCFQSHMRRPQSPPNPPRPPRRAFGVLRRDSRHR